MFLSPHSAASIAGLVAGLQGPDLAIAGQLGTVVVDAKVYGISRPLGLEAPSHNRRFSVSSAATDATSIDPASALTAARSFADDIIRRGRVDFGDAAGDRPMLNFGRRFTTHKLVSDDGTSMLQRCCFDCGLRRD